MTEPNDDESDVSTQSPKVIRANAKRAVTRVINDPIGKSITADGVANLDEKRDRLKSFSKRSVCKRLKKVSLIVMNLINAILISVKFKIISLKPWNRWRLPCNVTSVIPDTPDMERLVNAINMCKVELEVFNGKPMKYPQFMHEFDLNVHEIFVMKISKRSHIYLDTRGYLFRGSKLLSLCQPWLHWYLREQAKPTLGFLGGRSHSQVFPSTPLLHPLTLIDFHFILHLYYFCTKGPTAHLKIFVPVVVRSDDLSSILTCKKMVCISSYQCQSS